MDDDKKNVVTIDDDEYRKDNVEAGRNDEGKEGIVVTNAYTIVDPRTVVIHLKYTPVTGRAVVGPVWFEHVTPSTGT